ncbi:taurine catabolism dioxygenase tauD, tfdA family protein [Hirsutella rhossiliensis]|uniref:Taurine catabolism dioxygenase tauD, tfdA family domain-containing protein n=1 Tax=Hirsutella rhossiliensis TaxID=111463 RepID=A0A9P8N7K8_9HYPO|nr:taurine catabolism dioxygenase tauD, tfdA family domain-containing protein [Hirsutella rhossiliensis]KAH0968017.1 taurine catabolism dioxygenase tauD, tfdA family domain-containing protein [Hirsutella rhossiliensis]
MLSPTRIASRAVSAAAAPPRTLRLLLPRPTHLSRLLQHGGSSKSSNRTTRTLMSSSRARPARRMPEDAPQLRYTMPAFPDEPVTIAWTVDAIFAQDDARKDVQALRPMTLRDSCACARCRDPFSGNKTYRSTEIPDGLGIAHVEPSETGLVVTFAHDIPRLSDGSGDSLHQTLVPWNTVEVALRRRGAREPEDSEGEGEGGGGGNTVMFPRQRSVTMQTGVRYWDRAVLDQEVRTIDFDDYMQGGPAFWDAVLDVCRLGIVYLRNVPRDERSVVDITTRMANIRETFYGRTFDVRAKPGADNVAYTSGALGLHQDLLYLDPPPMVQVLHCLDNSCDGGESLFSDGDRAAHLLWPFVRASRRLAPLDRRLIPYHYAGNGFHYHALRPVLRGPDRGGSSLPDLFWSPPFQAPHDYAARDLRPWVDAARFLERLFSAPDAVHRRKLQPGECVIFNNLRVLHGRTAFDPGSDGHRWLRGAYIAAEDFLSRAAHVPLAQAHAYRGPVPWTPDVAREALRLSQWHAELRTEVCNFDPPVARRLVR